MAGWATGTVTFPVPAEAAYDYLADPRNRPAWQSSLRRIEALSGTDVRVGQRWVDVTVPGLRPAMETTEAVRPRRWAERGTWRGLSAELTLDFAPSGSGSTVGFRFRVTGRGPLAPLARLLTLTAVPAVRGDLRRAARLAAAGRR
ncbi:SRPBCC family protein [Nocardioides ferulae]|uniref:SRPBCC family protein n=1 Tax=Nocardioides ferulae TaxID=2340821 RepID=UPI000EB25091|nr:SRPBCC family protein [Nocardioides ferulae]